MIRQTRMYRASALLLAAALAVSCTAPAAAEPIGDGVTPAYDEAYYATLDYYGNLLEGSVVKSYTLNGTNRLTDYGVYDEVVNLTDSTAAVRGDGETSFQFSGETPEHFYFEGKTSQPFQDLPWTVAIHYTLNGVPTKAEDLAGQQGVVEILLDIVPNENASEYARYNYTLEAMALFNQDDILSLEAPGAQVQLVGNLRTVLFLALPGEEQHFTIRAGSNDFSFGGLTVLMVPATLAQLEEIAKLSQRKEELEDDYNALSGSLDNLLDALSNIQNGLYASAKGLDQLDIARQTFSGGKGVLYEGTDRLREDLSNLADLLEPVEERVQLLSQTVTDSTAVLNELTDTAMTLQAQLVELEEALRGLEDGSDDAKHVIHLAANLEDSLLRLERALGGTHISAGSVSTNSSALVNQVKTVRGAYDAEDEAVFMQKMLEAQGMGSAQAAAQVKSLGELAAAVNGGLIPPESLSPEQKQALATAKQMQTLHQNKGYLTFQGFCEQLPGISQSQAAQMNNLWIIYSSGDVLSSPSRPAPTPEPDPTPDPTPTPDPVPTPDPDPEPEPDPDPDPDPTPDPGPDPEPAPVPEPNPDGNASGGSESAPDTASEKGTTEAPAMIASLLQNDPEDGSGGEDTSGGDTPGESPSPDEGSAPGEGGDSGEGDTPTPPSSSGNQTVGGAMVDIITSGIDSATARIDQIQRELTNSLNEIKGPTANVVGQLADVCSQLETLIPVLDDAEDVSAALRQSTEILRTLLDSVDSLRVVLNNYEPTLQEALANAGTLSTSAVATIRDTEALIADAENLAQSTGSQLDEGTKQSLHGLSAALRQTAKALATTGDVKDAKNTITDIIEDTWDEYTGDINNLLLMDATADPVSLTDERNPTPSSIQVLIRTQEIKVEEAEEDEEAAAGKAATTFWDRVSQMFQDFWQAITGIFH